MDVPRRSIPSCSNLTHLPRLRKNAIPPPRDPLRLYAQTIEAQRRCGYTDSDVKKLYWKFKSYDVLNEGMVTVDEFVIITREGEEHEMFLRLVFLLFDGDMSGQISFAEYLMAMYHFVSLDGSDLALFTFSIFDLDAGTGGGGVE